MKRYTVTQLRTRLTNARYSYAQRQTKPEKAAMSKRVMDECKAELIRRGELIE